MLSRRAAAIDGDRRRSTAIDGAVGTQEDRRLFFLKRTGVHCGYVARCGGHLGHVFDDGPPPVGTASTGSP